MPRRALILPTAALLALLTMAPLALSFDPSDPGNLVVKETTAPASCDALLAQNVSAMIQPAAPGFRFSCFTDCVTVKHATVEDGNVTSRTEPPICVTLTGSAAEARIHPATTLAPLSQPRPRGLFGPVESLDLAPVQSLELRPIGLERSIFADNPLD